jgi:hypothetical protein
VVIKRACSAVASYLCFGTLCGSLRLSRGRCFIFGALVPVSDSQSGLVTNTQTYRETNSSFYTSSITELPLPTSTSTTAVSGILLFLRPRQLNMLYHFTSTLESTGTQHPLPNRIKPVLGGLSISVGHKPRQLGLVGYRYLRLSGLSNSTVMGPRCVPEEICPIGTPQYCRHTLTFPHNTKRLLSNTQQTPVNYRYQQ